MAFQQAIEIDNSGVTATYWRIRSGSVDFPPTGGALITVTLDGWVSAAARAAGKDALVGAHRRFDIPCENASDAEGLTAHALYDAVRIFPEFITAIDV